HWIDQVEHGRDIAADKRPILRGARHDEHCDVKLMRSCNLHQGISHARRTMEPDRCRPSSCKSRNDTEHARPLRLRDNRHTRTRLFDWARFARAVATIKRDQVHLVFPREMRDVLQRHYRVASRWRAREVWRNE